jgi:hypothetical protein
MTGPSRGIETEMGKVLSDRDSDGWLGVSPDFSRGKLSSLLRGLLQLELSRPPVHHQSAFEVKAIA